MSEELDNPFEQLRATEDKARELIRELAAATLMGNGVATTRERLKPRDEDYARVFSDAIAENMKTAYESLWTAEVAVGPNSGQSEILVIAATVVDLQLRTDRGRRFPGGYADVSQYLVDGPTWVRWKFVKPGESLGLAFDGLVWLDDHWAWFPKPWRALGAALRE